jgi:uncharacterized protein with PIN domain
MIVVDTSALLAILFDEPEKQAFKTIVAGAQRKASWKTSHLRCRQWA